MFRILRFHIVVILSILIMSCGGNTGKTAEEKVVLLDVDSVAREVIRRETQEQSPISIQSPDYSSNKILKGTYIRRSTDKKFIESTTKIIDIHQLTDTSSFFQDQHYMYLANDERIALFNTRHPKEDRDVAGVFEGGSLVCVDTIFYNAIYNDSDKAPMTMADWYDLMENNSSETYPLVYDVWYAVRINGKSYYTDYKLHNYIESKLYLPTKNQIFVLCSQATGYDGIYDLGYPDYYEVAVFEQTNLLKENWKRVYRSAKLDLNNGGADEYGVFDYFMAPEGGGFESPIDSKGNVSVEIEGCYKLMWDGKALSVIWDKEYLSNKGNKN